LAKIRAKDYSYIIVLLDLDLYINHKFVPRFIIVQRYVTTTLRSFYGFPISRKSGALDGPTDRRADGRTDGRGETFNAAPREGCIINRPK